MVPRGDRSAADVAREHSVCGHGGTDPVSRAAHRNGRYRQLDDDGGSHSQRGVWRVQERSDWQEVMKWAKRTWRSKYRCSKEKRTRTVPPLSQKERSTQDITSTMANCGLMPIGRC